MSNFFENLPDPMDKFPAFDAYAMYTMASSQSVEYLERLINASLIKLNGEISTEIIAETAAISLKERGTGMGIQMMLLSIPTTIAERMDTDQIFGTLIVTSFLCKVIRQTGNKSILKGVSSIPHYMERTVDFLLIPFKNAKNKKDKTWTKEQEEEFKEFLEEMNAPNTEPKKSNSVSTDDLNDMWNMDSKEEDDKNAY